MDLTLLADHAPHIGAGSAIVLPLLRRGWLSLCDHFNAKWDREDEWDRFVQARDRQEDRPAVYGRMDWEDVDALIQSERAHAAAVAGHVRQPGPAS